MRLIFLALAVFLVWFWWKRYDYLDTHGSFFLTLEEDSVVIHEPGAVAIYTLIESAEPETSKLILQRGMIHSDGWPYYTESLFLYLGNPEKPGSKGPFRRVIAPAADTLCDSKSGGYSLRGIDHVPTELLAFPIEGCDTLRFRLHRQLQPYPAEAPTVAWWTGPLRILRDP